MLRVGQNRIYTLYMTVCMVISLLSIPYVHHIRMYIIPYVHHTVCTPYTYKYMVLAHPINALFKVQAMHDAPLGPPIALVGSCRYR